MHQLAAEGGYQLFNLGGTDKALLYISLIVALGGLAIGYALMQGVLKADDGTDDMKKIAVARFARNFANMIGAGVPILQALRIVGETSGNWVIENALVQVAESVRQGESIAGPLADQPVFPAMVTQMIAVGEDSGSLETMLNKIADFYDQEVEAATEQLTAMIEPLSTERSWCGSIVSGLDGNPMVSVGFFAWARAARGATATAAAAAADFGSARRVGIDSSSEISLRRALS